MHLIYIGQAPQYLSDLCIHNFCSQWQILAEVDWLNILRSAKNKNQIQRMWFLLQSSRLE